MIPNKQAGGSAFPIDGVSGGMTLRDYFAAAALPAIIQESRQGTVNDVKIAYQYANAMLAERGKNDTTNIA